MVSQHQCLFIQSLMNYSCDPEWMLWTLSKGRSSEKALLSEQNKYFIKFLPSWIMMDIFSFRSILTFILPKCSAQRNCNFFLNSWKGGKLVWLGVCCFGRRSCFACGWAAGTPSSHLVLLLVAHLVTTYHLRGWKYLTMLSLACYCSWIENVTDTRKQIIGP